MARQVTIWIDQKIMERVARIARAECRGQMEIIEILVNDGVGRYRPGRFWKLIVKHIGAIGVRRDYRDAETIWLDSSVVDRIQEIADDLCRRRFEVIDIMLADGVARYSPATFFTLTRHVKFVIAERRAAEKRCRRRCAITSLGPAAQAAADAQ